VYSLRVDQSSSGLICNGENPKWGGIDQYKGGIFARIIMAKGLMKGLMERLDKSLMDSWCIDIFGKHLLDMNAFRSNNNLILSPIGRGHVYIITKNRILRAKEGDVGDDAILPKNIAKYRDLELLRIVYGYHQ